MLALDLGTTAGWALRSADGLVTSGSVWFRPSRYEGGGMRYARLRAWLERLAADAGPIGAIYFEEVRPHVGTDGERLRRLARDADRMGRDRRRALPGRSPSASIKRHATGKGNAAKESVMAAARARGFGPADDNDADAIAILLWAIETERGVV